jgi:methyl-accepting chemotaxis protein
VSAVEDVTQKNASAAEELGSTAEELAAQAESLRQLISYFTIAGAGPRGLADGAPSWTLGPARLREEAPT